MRKLIVCFVLVAAFGIGLGVGLGTPTAKAGFCYWMCGCNGVPYKCCVTPFGTSCKPDPNGPIQCTQSADC